MSDYDREQWQESERAREDAQTAFRDKMAKSRERSANNAKRKIARLHTKLKELGHISDFEDEFGESVLERLEKFGSAFHDPEKGRAGDALSTAQRQVVNRMNKKVKELKAKQRAKDNSDLPDDNFVEDYVRTGWNSTKDKDKSSKSSFGQKGGFKSKTKFTPRVRQIEENFDTTEPAVEAVGNASSLPVFDETVRPFIPQYKTDETHQRASKASARHSEKPPSDTQPKSEFTKKPFLRLVPSDRG